MGIRLFISLNYNIIVIMNSSKFRMPHSVCAFHQYNNITHFCKSSQCLLPLCRDCLVIHQKQHINISSSFDLVSIDDQNISTYNIISQQLNKLQHIYIEIIEKLKHSNYLHSQLRGNIMKEKQKYVIAFNSYFESLCKEMDLNYQRKEKWLKEISELYLQVRQELAALQNNLQGDKYLRTIIMWNKLKPQDSISNITKKIKKQFQPPSSSFCDVQQIISLVDKSQKLTVLDLQGDLGLLALSKLIYKLRYGQQDHSSSNNNSQLSIKGGISLISKDPGTNRKLKISKSSGRI